MTSRPFPFAPAFLLVGLVAAEPSAHAAVPAWPQFRGPNASGVAEAEKPPIQFGPASNLVWSTPLPPGASSPCVWGERIFLTALTDGKLETVCVGRSDGRMLWRQTAPAERLEPFHPTEGSPASATPAADGQRVVVYFGSFGLLSYDLAGKELWRRPLPIPTQVGDFGSGCSPVLSRGRVLLNRDQMDGSCLLAVDAESGREVWRAERPEFKSGYSTPVVFAHDGVEDVVLAGTLALKAYDPGTGAERWTVRGLPVSTCTTPVSTDGLLFFAGWSPGKADAPMPTWERLLESDDKDGAGFITIDKANPMWKGVMRGLDADKDGRLTREEWQRFVDMVGRGENVILAVRPGGTGDITTTHVAWKQTRGVPYVASPLAYRGRLYVVKDGGMVSCFEGRTGKAVYEQERLGVLGSYYASPVAADGRIYFCSVSGTVVVIEAGDRLEVLARNALGERLVATPAIVDNTIYVRTDKALYAFKNRF